MAIPGQKPPPCQGPPGPQPPPWPQPPPPWPKPPRAWAACGADSPTIATASAAIIILRNIHSILRVDTLHAQSRIKLAFPGHSGQPRCLTSARASAAAADALELLVEQPVLGVDGGVGGSTCAGPGGGSGGGIRSR